MPLEGKQIGRYHILHILGSGGMGEVYLAEDARIGQQVAIKVMRAEISPYDDRTKDDARLFLREAKAIAVLDHPRILPLFDYGDANIDTMIFAYLVMPYRQEGSLADWLRRRGDARLSIQEAAHVLDQAADALQHAHDRHIIHQDVKPSNFLVRSKKASLPDIFLTDFGVARLASATSNASQAVRGTPTYMAPEQWEGEPVVATDQYALAVMIYELLTGRPPFQGNPGRMMYQHINTPASPASTINPSIPAAVDAVLLRALSKRPEERFDSVSTFSNAFQQAVASSTGSSTIVRPSSGVGETNRGTAMNTATATSEDNLATYRKPITPPAGSSIASFQPHTAHNPGSLSHYTSPGTHDIHATLAISREEASNGTTRTITLPGGKQTTVLIPPNVFNGYIMRIEVAADESGITTAVFLTMAIQDATPPSMLTREAVQATQETAIVHDMTRPPSQPHLPTTPVSFTPAPGTLAASPTHLSMDAAAHLPPGNYNNGGTIPPMPTRPRSSGRLRLISIGIILLVLVLSSAIVVYAVPGVAHAIFGGGIANTTPTTSPTTVVAASSAQITITPTTKDVKNTFNIVALPTTPDVNQRQIAARYTDGINTDRKTVTATGSKTIPATAAQGSLTFYNSTTTYILNVPSGISWTGSDGIVVVNDQPVSLQPNTSTTVSAHTTTAGANTNIAYHDISADASNYLTPVVTPTPTPTQPSPTPTVAATTQQTTQLTYMMPNSGSGTLVTNEAAFTGGQDAQTTTVVSQSDISGAESQLVATLKPLSIKMAKDKILANDRIIRDVFCKTETSSDQAVGTAAANVTVTTKETCSYEVYNQNDALGLAENLLKDQTSKDPGQNYVLTGNVTTKIGTEKYNGDETMTISVDASGTWVFQFSDAQKQQLIQSVRGKDLNTAQSFLSGQNGVGQVKIELGDPHSQLLPTDANKITIVIK